MTAGRPAVIERAPMPVPRTTVRWCGVLGRPYTKHDSENSEAARQKQPRGQVSPPEVDGDTEVRFLLTPSGEILQVLPSEEDEPVPIVQEG